MIPELANALQSPANVQTIIEDYPYAIVHLATYLPKRERTSHLIFGWVELLPHGFPQPESCAPEPMTVKGRNEGLLYHSRIAMTGHAAIQWYEAAKSNALLTPEAMDDQIEDLHGIPVATQLFGEDSIWPRLSLFTGSDGAKSMRYEMPFVPDWQVQPRVHRVFGKPDGRLAEIVDRPEQADWLQTRMWLNFTVHPEWLGGLALVAPNPLWSAMRQRLIPECSTSGERSIIRFEPRPGVDLTGLEVVVYERRQGAVSSIWRGAPGPAAALTFDHERPVDALGVAIYDKERGLIHSEPPRHFLRNINIAGSIVEATRELEAPTASGGSEKFEVPDHLGFSWSVGEGTRQLDAAGVAAAQRGRRAAGEALGQRWFRSNAETAAAFVRSLIGEARQRVHIYDPYVTGLELFRFLQAVSRRTVGVRAVSSSLPFKGLAPSDELRLLAELEQEKVRLRTYRNGSSYVQISMLKGKHPALHDRFLVVDDEVWFTGNSLGTLGDRAGMMIRLPDPAPVLAELESLFEGAESVDKFLARRRRTLLKAGHAA